MLHDDYAKFLVGDSMIVFVAMLLTQWEDRRRANLAA